MSIFGSAFRCESLRNVSASVTLRGMKVYTLPDVTMTGAAVAVSATSQLCRWYKIVGTTIASAAARVGDSAVTTSRGTPITTTAPFEAPPLSLSFGENYDLADVYVAGTNNDKVSVVYGM